MIIDISTKMDERMFTFPGNTPFSKIGPYTAVSGKYREFCYNLTMTTQTGTHIQGPHYFLSDGKKIDDYPLETFEGEVIIIDLVGFSIIDKELLSVKIGDEKIDRGKVILLKTGFMERIAQNKQENTFTEKNNILLEKPGITLSGADHIAKLAPKILGIDSFGFEVPNATDFEVNHFFCQKGIILLEGLINLNKVKTGAILEAFPLPIPNVEGTPCRAIARNP
jgi:arylformamidase